LRLNLIFKASITLLCTTACTKQNPDQFLKSEIAQLKSSIEGLKPGLGEIMGTIQQHHAKLYFSGENKNWDLATYQLDEIREGLDQATEVHEHFKDVKASLKDLRHMTDASMEETKNAIKNQSKSQFLNGFKNLTTSCNQCHQAAEHGFIVIQIPAAPMFSNQKFTRGPK